MSVVATAADPSAVLNKILRGNYQQAADAWAKIEPKLSSFAAGLAAAIKRDDAEVIAFEYKRVEAFNRGVGALLNRIAAALEDLDAIAGDPDLAAVQTRAAAYVRSLGAMKKTLTNKLEVANALQAKAVKAMNRARQRGAEFDADWERLQDQVDQTAKSFESLHQRMTRLRAELKAARPLTLPMAESRGGRCEEARRRRAVVQRRPAARRARADRRRRRHRDDEPGVRGPVPEGAAEASRSSSSGWRRSPPS